MLENAIFLHNRVVTANILHQKPKNIEQMKYALQRRKLIFWEYTQSVTIVPNKYPQSELRVPPSSP